MRMHCYVYYLFVWSLCHAWVHVQSWLETQLYIVRKRLLFTWHLRNRLTGESCYLKSPKNGLCIFHSGLFSAHQCVEIGCCTSLVMDFSFCYCRLPFAGRLSVRKSKTPITRTLKCNIKSLVGVCLGGFFLHLQPRITGCIDKWCHLIVVIMF